MKARVTIEIPFKDWKKAEAAKVGITVHALEQRLYRGHHMYPAGLQRGIKRAVKVIHLEHVEF